MSLYEIQYGHIQEGGCPDEDDGNAISKHCIPGLRTIDSRAEAGRSAGCHSVPAAHYSELKAIGVFISYEEAVAMRNRFFVVL